MNASVARRLRLLPRLGTPIVVAVAAVLLSAVVPASTTAAVAAQQLPVVTISPLKGTPDASPTTQISFLGVPAPNISAISARGTASGYHGGNMKAYANGEGGSFIPSRPFTSGETVHVTATEALPGRSTAIGTTFKVATLVAIPLDGPHYFPAIAGSIVSLASRPDLAPPSVSVGIPATDSGLGDIFLTPTYGDSQYGAMIISPAGRLIWFQPAPAGYQDANLRVQSYLGNKVLTYWQGQIAMGHGEGYGVIRSADYQPLTTVKAGNGLVMDMHDFTLGPNGVAYITIYDPVKANLTSVGGPPAGQLEDSVVQEIDVRTGLVMFEWHALGHVPLSDSHWPAPQATDTSTVYDFFHINTIQVLSDGNLLVNGRNTWAAYKLDHATGAILWQVGGKHSTFKLGKGVCYAWQHDATLLPDNEVQFFDNESLPQVRARSRGIVIKLNFRTDTAMLVHSYVDERQPVLSPSQGDTQLLANGDRFLGFGQIGLIAQFTQAGTLDFQMDLAPNVQSYRALRFPWSATPAKTRPTAVASRLPGATSTTVTVSWNGVTTVKRWQLLAGSTKSSLHPVGAPTANAGFETQLATTRSASNVAVRAIGAHHNTLATSPTVAIATPAS